MLAAGGFAGGWAVNGWRHDAIDLARDRAAQRTAARQSGRVEAAAGSHEQTRAAVEVRRVNRIVEVERVVEKPVYRNVCLDDDGLRLINAAVTAAVAGEPEPAVPAAAASASR